MKKSDLVKLIVPLISANGPGDSVSTANLILKRLDELRILNPKHKVSITRLDIEAMPYEDFVEVSGWEKE